jgi:nucleoside-diphosphate-sugar epimerase
VEYFCERFPHWDKLSSSRILITGGTGMIGTFLIDMIERYNELSGSGIGVIVIGRNRENAAKRFGPGFTKPSFDFIEADLSQSVPELPCVDYMIHAGGNSHPGAFSSDPVGTMRSNLFGTDALLDHARRTGLRSFLYVSSGEVYGICNGLDSVTESYSGSLDITNPRSCYPSSKRAAETLCASYASQYGIHAVIVRPCHVYGPTFVRSDTRIASRFIMDALDGKDIVMKSAGTQVRSYCYVGDCAVGMLTALVAGAQGNAYNIANRDSVASIREYAEAVANACGVRITTVLPTSAETAAFNPVERIVLDQTKLEGLGWKPSVDLHSGIDRTVAMLNF